MLSFHLASRKRSLNRAQQLREAVLLVLCETLPTEYVRLLGLSRKEWQDLLHWLDTSGLALYFLDRLSELDLLEVLPSPVLARLKENLADNTERINAMIAESVGIQRRFQWAHVSYAVLKGFSLSPISVPKLHLRSQLDLDFLVSEESAQEARRILEDTGYRLNAISGRSWEFKGKEDRPSGMKGLYKTGMSRSAELHLETVQEIGASLLSRSRRISFHGVSMPVLSPVDLFLGQGLHLYKHLCSEFSRTAHVIEFRRHVVARRHDNAFWNRLRQQVADEQGTCARLGLVVHLISCLTGAFAPEALTCWTVDRLPAAARLWVDMYGRRTVLASFPGSKLYLLLQKELEAAGVPAKRSPYQALLPRRLPPAITHPVAGETLLARIHRYLRELRYISFRFRFHFFEGIRYLCESILWRQYRNELSP
ncbi:nucleotidyltransferase family protein [Acidicapsa acidisoli]|uniref:nucleotidyltransferase family protein n=1 Tax=Acidicapsa acidisoli TaxID=1615681 RepID=UPI0021DF88B2|nr:nucleotidyltransferase family protein [Acidicapsa acidisoli]